MKYYRQTADFTASLFRFLLFGRSLDSKLLHLAVSLQFLLNLIFVRLKSFRRVAFNLSHMIEFAHHGQAVSVVLRPGILDFPLLIKRNKASSSAHRTFHIIPAGFCDHKGGVAAGTCFSVFQITQSFVFPVLLGIEDRMAKILGKIADLQDIIFSHQRFTGIRYLINVDIVYNICLC